MTLEKVNNSLTPRDFYDEQENHFELQGLSEAHVLHNRSKMLLEPPSRLFNQYVYTHQILLFIFK